MTFLFLYFEMVGNWVEILRSSRCFPDGKHGCHHFTVLKIHSRRKVITLETPLEHRKHLFFFLVSHLVYLHFFS